MFADKNRYGRVYDENTYVFEDLPFETAYRIIECFPRDAPKDTVILKGDVAPIIAAAICLCSWRSTDIQYIMITKDILTFKTANIGDLVSFKVLQDIIRYVYKYCKKAKYREKYIARKIIDVAYWYAKKQKTTIYHVIAKEDYLYFQKLTEEEK